MGQVCETLILGKSGKKKNVKNQDSSKSFSKENVNSNINNNIINDNKNSILIVQSIHSDKKNTEINNKESTIFTNIRTNIMTNINKNCIKTSHTSNFSNLTNSKNKSVNRILREQLKESIVTKKISESATRIVKSDISINFQENYAQNIPLNDGEKAGCGQLSINTFCLFKSNNKDIILVYSVKNIKDGYIRIYALNMDHNEKTILYDNNLDKNSNNSRIPTQCKCYNIENEEYIIVGFRDSFIYLWVFKNSIFEKIKIIEKDGCPINGISLFKNKSNNQLNIIFSEKNKSVINIMNFNDEINNIHIKKNIYYLDILEKDNKLYIIAGLLNKVILFEFEEKSIKIYKNDKNLNKKSYEKGHECVITYKSNENNNDIKIIDSDTEGKCINIFNFETTELLLILDLIDRKPLGINIWNEKYIIVSCLEFKDNNSIKIIKITLNKILYNQKYVDLVKNEDGAEAKIFFNLKGHENGTISILNMKNTRFGDFFVSIGKDHCLKFWINDEANSFFV